MSDDFFDDLKRMHKGLHFILQDMVSPYDSWNENPMSWKPFIDMYEDNGKLIIVIDIAGVNPDDVKVVLQGNYLYIKGERKPFEMKGKVIYYEMEIRFGTFERVIPLPFDVNPDTVNVKAKNGLLRLEFERLNPEEKIIPIK